MDQGNERPGAVILGGSFHSLGAARNLAKHGVPVCVLDSAASVCRFSRSVRHFVRCPPADDEAGFVVLLEHLAGEEDMSGWVLFPSTDQYVRIVALHRERLSKHYRLTTPPWDVVKFVYDKRLTYRLADELGIPTPKTHNPQSVEDLVLSGLDYPLVLKPAVSKHFMAVTRKKAFRADNEQELIDLYGTMAGIVDPSEILVQELIPGRAENLYSFGGFFKDGVPVAGIAARRPRQHPMEFGRASTYVESVKDPGLETLAVQFLKAIGFSGLAEVEFMYDQKDGRFELLEVNPRIWGWHTIAVRAGLDLPYMAYADGIGQEVTTGPPREGVKWVRLVTDIPTALPEVLSGRMAMRQYLASMRGDVEFAVLSFSDPLPFIADLFLGPYNYAKGRGF